MNFNLSMNQGTQYLQNKLNQNNHFMNQQQLSVSRYINNLNNSQFMSSTNNLTSSPPLNGQFNPSNNSNSSNTNSSMQQQHQLQQQNFPMISPNMMFQQNPINHLNFNNSITQQQK
jgi:hypothetical protein